MTEEEHTPHCNRRLEVLLPDNTAKAYYCELDVDHQGLHRSTMYGQERARVWTLEGIDFLEGPYEPASDPASLTCEDEFTDAAETHIFCVRPKGHSGQHGNYHAEQCPVLWNTLEVGKGAKDVMLYGDGPVPEGAIPARFEIVINSGHVAIPQKVRLNGLELPNVKGLTIEYTKDDARTVLVEILATGIFEVPEMSLAGFTPHAKLKIKVGDTEIDAAIESVSHEMGWAGPATTHINWVSVDGMYNGSATVPYTDQLELTEPLTADSMFKHYSTQPDYKSPWFEPKLKPKEIAVDLSQIEADLAKLPAPTPPELGTSIGAKGVSPLQSLTDVLLAADNSAFLTQKQFYEYATTGNLFLDDKGNMLPLTADAKVHLAHGKAPLGKVTDLKTTDAGLEFSVQLKDLDDAAISKLYGVPIDTIYTDEALPPKNALVEGNKGFGKNKKLQEANDKLVMEQALKQVVTTLYEGLSPGAPHGVLGIAYQIVLPNGRYLNIKISAEPVIPFYDHHIPKEYKP